MEAKTYLTVTGLISAITGCLVVALMLVTSPAAFGPAGVTFWFLLLLISLSGAFTLGLFFLKGKILPAAKQYHRLIHSKRQGLLLAGLAVIFLALSSLRQLSWRDVILVIILLGLVEFYFRTKL